MNEHEIMQASHQDYDDYIELPKSSWFKIRELGIRAELLTVVRHCNEFTIADYMNAYGLAYTMLIE